MQSELRLAATFTGGVSLAVWMGGVARETNLLAGAGRSGGRGAERPALPAPGDRAHAHPRVNSPGAGAP